MRYRPIPPDACVIAWKHVKRHRPHDACLKRVPTRGRRIFNSENVNAGKIYRQMQNVYTLSVYHGNYDGVGIFVVEKDNMLLIRS